MLYRLRRWATKAWNQRWYAIDQRRFRATLDAVGLKPGSTVCVHSTLTGLGHFKGGPDMIIDTLQEAIGRAGTLLMPTFPSGGSAAEVLDRGDVFDVRSTPSKVGFLTEVFRRRPGVVRSVHPTNPVAGWGGAAWDIVKDHDKSETAYGRETPYGRLADFDDAYILMLGTHVQSFLHHIQERIDFPNLYLPEPRTARVVDHDGRTSTMTLRAMRPRVPYFVPIPSATPETRWAILHDYCLMFERNRERVVAEAGYDFSGYPRLFQRRKELEERGALRSARLGRGNVGLLNTKMYLHYIEPEFRETIRRFRDQFDVDRILALNLPYL